MFASPISFLDCEMNPRRTCATSLTIAQLAETSLEDATAEYLRVDDLGRDIHQREMIAKYLYTEEKDDEGDVNPDGFFR